VDGEEFSQLGDWLDGDRVLGLLFVVVSIGWSGMGVRGLIFVRVSVGEVDDVWAGGVHGEPGCRDWKCYDAGMVSRRES
jgi:hypothetical protein